MSVWITTLIKYLLLPQCSFLILTFWGCWRLRNKRKYGFIIITTTLVLWYILSTSIVGRALSKSLETYPALSTQDINAFKADAIIVLAGGIREFSPEYGRTATVTYQSLERLRYTAKLAKATHLPVLITGGKVMDQTLPPEAEVLAQTLHEDFGISARWLETQSRNTTENAEYSYAKLNALNISKILLITQAAHMPRAVGEFRHVGFNVLPAPTGFLGDFSSNNFFSFLPSGQAFALSSASIHEYLGKIWSNLKMITSQETTHVIPKLT